MLRAAARHVSTINCTSARWTVRSPRRALASLSAPPDSRALPFCSRLNCRSFATAVAALKPTQAVRLAHPDLYHSNTNADTPDVFSFFEKLTATWQYILVDPGTLQAAIIDPVLDYNPASGEVSTTTADGLLAFVEQRGLHVDCILETHAHADHLTAAQYLKFLLPGNVPVGIGKRITQVQKTFAPIYGFDDPTLFSRAFDVYFADDEHFKLGNYTCRVMHLPGHTPDHVGYMFGSAIFTGDSIFNPDVGSARADFPGGNARDLFASMQRLLSLPPATLLYVGHDYPPSNGRSPTTSATVEEHRAAWQGTDAPHFVAWREKRDAALGTPKLLHPSLQVNIRGGRLPPKDERGRVWFKTPIRAPEW